MNDVTKDLLEALKDCERVIDILWASHHANRADAALEKARAAIARAEAAVAEEEKMYVQAVPDHCDRITWRGSYYHLPILSKPAAPQPDADGWIPWAGGECPVPKGTEFFARLRDLGEYGDDMPEGWRWSHSDPRSEEWNGDIIAYRVVKP